MLSGHDGHNQQTQNTAGATNERFSGQRTDQQVHDYNSPQVTGGSSSSHAARPHMATMLAASRASYAPQRGSASLHPPPQPNNTSRAQVQWQQLSPGQRPPYQQLPQQQQGWRPLPVAGQPLHAGQGPVGYQLAAGGSGYPSTGRGRGRAWRSGASSVGSPAWSVVGGEDILSTAIAAVDSLSPAEPAESSVLVVDALMRMDSRQAASLFKQLGANDRLASRAWELFAWLRSLTATSAHAGLRGLLDVYVYTAMISLCAMSRNVPLALELSAEMDNRNISHNVHTFSALMNVLVKSGQSQHALEVFHQMQAIGCKPNLVTFNTLIDCYGKLGLWNEAMQVVQTMRNQGIEPVARTYNTLMIACTTSNAWQEALSVYQQMLNAGIRPNTTTFNAVISAYSKAGSMEMVMDTFQRMVDMGCERSVITYSTLISAAEKLGYWHLALQIFDRMRAENVHPNTITFNSIITACAQGMQFETAMRLFEQMQYFGCQPDVVSFTAAITACGRVCQWQRALTEFRRMQSLRCKEDHIVYEAILEALWSTGVRPAQRHAAQLHKEGVAKGLIRHPSLNDLHSKAEAGLLSAEVTLGMLNSGLLLMCLGIWLTQLRDYMHEHGMERLPQRVTVRVNRPRARELTMSGDVRRAINQWAEGHGCPLQLLPDLTGTGTIRIMIDVPQLASWLLSDAWHLVQFSTAFIPQESVTPVLADEERVYQPVQKWSVQCYHNVVTVWESSHPPPSLGNMQADYLHSRPAILQQLFQIGAQLRAPCEMLHDTALLLDRILTVRGTRIGSLQATVFAALLLVSEQPSPLPVPPLSPAAQARQQLQHPALLTPQPTPGQPQLVVPRPPGSLGRSGQSGGTVTLRVGQADQKSAWHLPLARLARLCGVSESELVTRAQAISHLMHHDTTTISAVHILRLFHVCLAYGDGLIPPPNLMFAPAILSTRQAQSLQAAQEPPTPPRPQQLQQQQQQQGTSSQEQQLVDAVSGLRLGSSSPRDDDTVAPDSPLEGGGEMAAAGAITTQAGPRPEVRTPSMSSGGVEVAGRFQPQQLRVQPAPRGRTSRGSGAGPSTLATSTEQEQVFVPRSSSVSGTTVAHDAPADVIAAPLELTSSELMSYRLLHEVVRSGNSIGFRSSTLAAAALYASRVMYGILPHLPTAMAQLLGITDLSDAEMCAAINMMTRINFRDTA